MTKNQKTVSWVKDRDFMFTSLVIWDDNYLPYSVIIFRKDNLNNHEIRMYVTINGLVYKEDFIIDIKKTNSEDEVLYRITNWAQKLINVYVIFNHDEEKMLHKNDASMACRNEMFLVDIISLKQEDLVRIRLKSPDFGFYSMAPNFDDYIREMETYEDSVLAINFSVLAERHNK
jgi:hypothetical protein